MGAANEIDVQFYSDLDIRCICCSCFGAKMSRVQFFADSKLNVHRSSNEAPMADISCVQCTALCSHQMHAANIAVIRKSSHRHCSCRLQFHSLKSCEPRA